MKIRGRPVHFFRNLSFQQKLLAMVIPLLIATVGLTGMFSYYIASNQVVAKIKDSQNHMASKTRDQLDYVAKDMLNFSNYLFINPVVQSMVISKDTRKNRDQLFKNLVPLMVTGNTIQSVILYPDPVGDEPVYPFFISQVGIANAITLEAFRKSEFYARLQAASGQLIWDLFRPSDGIIPGDYHHKIVLIKSFKDFYSFQTNGLLIIGMDADHLSKILYDSSDSAFQYIVNEQGIVVAASSLKWVGKPADELPFPSDSSLDDEYLVTKALSTVTGWQAVVIQDRESLLSELSSIRSITLIIALVVSFVMIALTWIMARIVTNPLRTLIRSMKALQHGDFTQRVNFTGNDEIGRLGYWYDTMVQRIKTLIDDVYFSRLKQKEAELKALQSQINPHFLYNTLNMINWSAVQKGDKEISELVVSLSQVFRLSLNSGQDFIQLEKEFELVSHYLFIQKKRYASRLHFDIELAPSLRHFELPKLLLQPLVENAIVHAIEPLDGSGHLSVRACQEEDWVVLQVTDNGKGMTPEQAETLRQRLARPSLPFRPEGSGSGIALINVKERLQLFDEQSSMDIDTRHGAGTRITIKLKLGR